MVYRIRYRPEGSRGDAEAVVEAKNAAEAMVKFCQSHAGKEGPSSVRQRIRSVSTDHYCDELPWPA
jgi:hypothetical protein